MSMGSVTTTTYMYLCLLLEQLHAHDGEDRTGTGHGDRALIHRRLVAKCHSVDGIGQKRHELIGRDVISSVHLVDELVRNVFQRFGSVDHGRCGFGTAGISVTESTETNGLLALGVGTEILLDRSADTDVADPTSLASRAK